MIIKESEWKPIFWFISLSIMIFLVDRLPFILMDFTKNWSVLDEKIKLFILSQDPETQEFLKQTYNASGTLDGFFTMVNEHDPAILESLKMFVNGN